VIHSALLIFGFGRNKVLNSASFLFSAETTFFGHVSILAEFIRISSGRCLTCILYSVAI